MRKDIEIHIKTGDVALVSKVTPELRTFKWVSQPTLPSRYIYGEVEVPYTISERAIFSQGIYVNIPYTPKYKEFMIRVRRINDVGVSAYVTNTTDGSQWFLAKSALYGGENKNVFASTLLSISENGFYMSIKDGVAQLYSSNQTDFNIVKAGRQNANCLLACFPGSNYRYPLAGVGLARWINSNNVTRTDLIETLQDQFSVDGVIINNASFDYDTKQLELDATDLEV